MTDSNRQYYHSDFPHFDVPAALNRAPKELQTDHRNHH